MTDEEAFQKYLVEIKTESSTALVVEMDRDFNIIKTHIFTDRSKIMDVTYDLVKKNYLVIENFEDCDDFFFQRPIFCKSMGSEEKFTC